MKMQIPLETEYMTLGQMLKEVSVISSGGQAKWYLAEHTVFVDGEPENRRGRKLYAECVLSYLMKVLFLW